MVSVKRFTDGKQAVWVARNTDTQPVSYQRWAGDDIPPAEISALVEEPTPVTLELAIEWQCAHIFYPGLMYCELRDWNHEGLWPSDVCKEHECPKVQSWYVCPCLGGFVFPRSLAKEGERIHEP